MRGLATQGWVSACRPPRALGSHEVHLWLVDLDSGPDPVWLWDRLTEEERRRVRGFRSEQDCARFSAARAVLRDLLHAYSEPDGRHEAPRELPLGRLPGGKLFLAPPAGLAWSSGSVLEFNLSHSHRHVLLAFARGCRVGVDLEYIRRSTARDLASRDAGVLSAAEARVLRSHEDGPQQASFFFALWTLKEALLKGLGTGLLGDNLSRVDMHRALTEDGPDPLMYSEGGGKRVWAMHPLPAPEGYAAALAVEGGGATLHFFEWLTAEDDCRDNSVGVPSSFGNVGRINHA